MPVALGVSLAVAAVARRSPPARPRRRDGAASPRSAARSPRSGASSDRRGGIVVGHAAARPAAQAGELLLRATARRRRSLHRRRRDRRAPRCRPAGTPRTSGTPRTGTAPSARRTAPARRRCSAASARPGASASSGSVCQILPSKWSTPWSRSWRNAPIVWWTCARWPQPWQCGPTSGVKIRWS